MPIAPVMPYMADPMLPLRAFEAGLSQPNWATSLMQGIAGGIQMASSVAGYIDKFGPEAKAAKAREAEMQQLQIQQAQQSLERGSLQLNQMKAEAPYAADIAGLKQTAAQLDVLAKQADLSAGNMRLGMLPQQLQNDAKKQELGLTAQQNQITAQGITLFDANSRIGKEAAFNSQLSDIYNQMDSAAKAGNADAWANSYFEAQKLAIADPESAAANNSFQRFQTSFLNTGRISKFDTNPKYAPLYGTSTSGGGMTLTQTNSNIGAMARQANSAWQKFNTLNSQYTAGGVQVDPSSSEGKMLPNTTILGLKESLQINGYKDPDLSGVVPYLSISKRNADGSAVFVDSRSNTSITLPKDQADFLFMASTEHNNAAYFANTAAQLNEVARFMADTGQFSLTPAQVQELKRATNAASGSGQSAPSTSVNGSGLGLPSGGPAASNNPLIDPSASAGSNEPVPLASVSPELKDIARDPKKLEEKAFEVITELSTVRKSGNSTAILARENVLEQVRRMNPAAYDAAMKRAGKKTASSYF